MKKKRINEKMGGGSRIGLGGVNSTGTSDNRYSTKHPTGYHTGGYQGNADSQFSQRQGLISTLEEEDEEIEYKEDQNMLEEEDLMEYFARMAKISTKEQDIMLESKTGDRIQQMITVALMSLLDDATGELSGIIGAVPILYKNIYEIYRTNNLIDLEYQKTQINKAELDRLRDQLVLEMTDIINAIVIALPMTGIDTIAAGLVTLLQSSAVGAASSYITEKYNNLIQSSPIIGKIFQALSYPLGGSVILKGVENIDRINQNKSILSKNQNSLYEYFGRIARLNEVQEIEEMHCYCDEVARNEASHCPMHEEEKEVSEMSAGGVAGVATPLGTDASGKAASNKKRKEQLDYFSKTYGIK